MVATSRQQKRYSGQLSFSLKNLIKLKLFSEPVRTFESPISTRIKPFCIGLFNARSVGTDDMMFITEI